MERNPDLYSAIFILGNIFFVFSSADGNDSLHSWSKLSLSKKSTVGPSFSFWSARKKSKKSIINKLVALLLLLGAMFSLPKKSKYSICSSSKSLKVRIREPAKKSSLGKDLRSKILRGRYFFANSEKAPFLVISGSRMRTTVLMVEVIAENSVMVSTSVSGRAYEELFEVGISRNPLVFDACLLICCARDIGY
ncbi:hypothetical protein D3C87_1269810 [compost metagenome]